MFGLQPPPIVQPATNDDQSDVIEVIGHRSDQTLKIDRRTYEVRQTPHSKQKDTLQLLRGLPAITITPDDQINLLGSAGVTILIDGHSTKTDLRTLHGSDIERIEIITNPSAQYSAEGTAGVINIVLRKTNAAGLSGNVTSEGSSLGRLNGGATVKYKRGKWSYEVSPEATTGEWSFAAYHKQRAIENRAGVTSTINNEDGRSPVRTNNGGLRAKATYALDPRTDMSAELMGGATRSSSINNAAFTAVTPGFQEFSQLHHGLSAANFLAGQLVLDHKGRRDGESLKASINIFGNPYVRQADLSDFSSGGSISAETRLTTFFSDNKIDWDHPIGKHEILSLGAEWFLERGNHRYRFSSIQPASIGSDVVDLFKGEESTLSAFLTFQQKLGTWSFMPGLRIEQNMRRVSSPGKSLTRIQRTDLFPTFHAEHPIGKTLDLTMSYSKRIGRPNLEQLRPYPVQQDILTVVEGNPRLGDMSTVSYEINLHYHRRKIDAGLIIYDRETSNFVSTSYTINPSLQNVETFINAGRKRDSGAEIDISAPLLSRVKAVASVNLFDSRVPLDRLASSGRDERFRYTTNWTLEWDGPDGRGKTGDIAQLIWYYESPSTQFQFRNFAWQTVSLAYTHSFSARLSLTATLDSKALHYGHRLLAPLVQEYYRLHNRPEFRLKLLKSFGKS